ncbi:MAG: DUF4290 domain-containing protein [Prevotellaceae bacterium]|nr:DUF4290 domain-containing protein [Prevotellaceae bacterium]
MKYTTLEEKLLMPEYGRNIQRMVKYCIAISDREERTRCAQSIIGTMGNMFPHLRDVSDFKHKLWDHLAIMSDFQLDIDYPYEIVKKENLYAHPEPLKYRKTKIRYAFYGHFVQDIIAKAIQIEDEDERKQLVQLLVHYMKRSYITWNRESVDNEKIFDDLRELSDGKLDFDPAEFHFSENIRNSNQNKKRPTNNKVRKK